MLENPFSLICIIAHFILFLPFWKFIFGHFTPLFNGNKKYSKRKQLYRNQGSSDVVNHILMHEHLRLF